MLFPFIEFDGDSKATTIFGSSKDSPASRILKQVGYPVSMLFLAATLAVFIILPDLVSSGDLIWVQNACIGRINKFASATNLVQDNL